jgi:hypothetical protein
MVLQTQNDRRPLLADEQNWVAERAQCGQLPPVDINSCVSETILTRIQDIATIARVQPQQFIATMDARERQNNPAVTSAPQQSAPAPAPQAVATEQTRQPDQSYPATQNIKLAAALPSVDREALLVAAAIKGSQVYAAGANDMAKGAARPGRARDICAAMPSAAVENWTGTVEELSSNGDGLGVLSVKIDSDVAVKTWNNSVSDISDHTLINPNSSVFRKAAALKVGQKVVFSGTFIPDQTDCLREGSMTLAGSLESPEFIFRFSDISPAE